VKRNSRKRPLVAAHRGASGIAPENTLAAFRRAINQGADILELDVRMTRDFHVVVHHDRDVRRTTGANGCIWDLTLQQIRMLDAGRLFHPRFAGQQIPTLRQVLEMVPSHVGVNIEAKTDGDPRKHLAFEEVCILIIMEKKFEDRVIVSSFDHRFLERIHRLFPAIRTGALAMPIRDMRKKPSQIARRTGAGAFICDRSMLRQKHVDDAHGRNILVGSYVINTPQHLREAVDLGVDVVVTDFPGRIVTGLKQLGFAASSRPKL
jgi:glycerophosphoryl diester phosphodiesterase